ncbi:MAG: YcxB family protein [Anaerolineales bacterium]
MQIIYSLVEDDLIKLAEFQLEKSGRLRKQAYSRRILYPVGFGLLGLGALLLTDDLVLPIMFGLSALISFFFVPIFYTWLTRRRLPQFVRSKMSSSSIGIRTVSISEKCLQQRVGELYSEVPWTIVHDIAETPDNVFVEIDGIFTLVIPKREVDGDVLNLFVEALRDKIQKTDT